MKIMGRGHANLLIISLVASILGAFASIHTAKGAGGSCQELSLNKKIDDVWGGARVKFSAIETRRSILVAYYDAARWLSVSRIDKCNGAISKVRINSQFGGWDSHNDVDLYSGPDGTIHLAANMHATPLIYAEAASEENLDALKKLRAMVGVDEEKVTYPSFFLLPSGKLGFLYRSGGAGDGKTIINAFDGHSWHRINENPLFSSGLTENSVSAYPTTFVLDKSGYYHVAWVWRESTAVESNFNINHARTRDFVEWKSQDGERFNIPFTPSNSPIVDEIPKNSGLINNIAIAIDSDNRPVISYLKFDSKGFSQLYHARYESKRWKIYRSSNWKFRWNPLGSGSLPMLISFSGIRDGFPPEEDISHPDLGSRLALYEKNNLRITGYKKRAPIIAGSGDDATLNPQRVKNWKINSIPANPGPSLQNRYFIQWGSSSEISRDKEHSCSSRDKKKCNFVFGMILVDSAIRPKH